ncbi:MAG: glycosyltransferase family 1 protein [Chloroflexi bacterium]|nr:glycosyltransferase family 1 protein [Chloroflexota bacterium]
MVRDYLLPYVDLYLKTQLVKDPSWYTRESPYGIYFRDFYHRQYDVEDDKTNPRDPVKLEHLNKLWLGWNIGLSDLDILGRPRPITHLLYRLPRVRYKGQGSPAQSSAAKHRRAVSRVSRATGQVDTFRFQRVEMRKHLDRLRETHPMFRYHMDGKVPKKVYDREMTDAVIIPSPFGDGATCYRDFEAILSGGVMLKADMGHLDMRPNFYIPGVTYIPHDWDFSDFAGKVLHILEHRSEYEAMARAAQQTYLKALSPEGGEDFALQFKEIVQEALARRSGSLRSA